MIYLAYLGVALGVFILGFFIWAVVVYVKEAIIHRNIMAYDTKRFYLVSLGFAVSFAVVILGTAFFVAWSFAYLIGG